MNIKVGRNVNLSGNNNARRDDGSATTDANSSGGGSGAPTLSAGDPNASSGFVGPGPTPTPTTSADPNELSLISQGEFSGLVDPTGRNNPPPGPHLYPTTYYFFDPNDPNAPTSFVVVNPRSIPNPTPTPLNFADPNSTDGNGPTPTAGDPNASTSFVNPSNPDPTFSGFVKNSLVGAYSSHF